MVTKYTSVCLVALALLGSLCDAQWGGAVQKPPTYQKPADKQEPSKKVPHDNTQIKQTFEKPLNWVYPEDPKPEVQPEVTVELSQPVPAATIAVQCREKDAYVEVKQDFFGIGQLVSPLDMSLGICGPVAVDNAMQVMIFQADLHDCGSSLSMTEDALIYTFNLNYQPQALGSSPVVRTTSAVVIVQCHYPRKHNVSSLALIPDWLPYGDYKVVDEFLYFTLKLMTADWQYERPIYQYYLGDIINIEATVMQYYHVPLRVYLDTCVATLTPDMTSNPKYTFIYNGCLIDGWLTGSESKFVARFVENKLQFHLVAFRFLGADSGLLYITCHLRATTTAEAIDTHNRACSYIGGWKEASGVHTACNTCEQEAISLGGAPSGVIGSGASTGSLSTTARKARDVSEREVLQWEGDVTLGPIPIEEKVMA